MSFSPLMGQVKPAKITNKWNDKWPMKYRTGGHRGNLYLEKNGKEWKNIILEFEILSFDSFIDVKSFICFKPEFSPQLSSQWNQQCFLSLLHPPTPISPEQISNSSIYNLFWWMIDICSLDILTEHNNKEKKILTLRKKIYKLKTFDKG